MPFKTYRNWGAVAILAVTGWIPPLGHASQSPPVDAVAEALRLRDTGDFAGAAKILRARLVEQPDNGDVARLLAQTLYWLHDIPTARAVYEAALVRHPQDSSLALQYGRMLIESGHRSRAREVLKPLQGIPATKADADALLGTLAYWSGDLTTARRLLDAAVRADPSQTEARRQLREIGAASSPWVRFSSSIGHDDQPLDHLTVAVQAGWFVTPLAPIVMRVEPATYRLEDSTTHNVVTTDVSIAHFAPAARLETELAGGVLQRSDGLPRDWTGRAMLGFRLPHHLTIRARAERTPYLFTTSSLDTPVIVQRASGLMRWTHPRGWLAEAAVQLERYPDDNSLTKAYAWQLIPIVNGRTIDLQMGYAFATEDADQSRFVLASPAQPFPPQDPRFSTAGVYVPYYTPNRVITHSAITAVAMHPGSNVTTRFGGAFALRATENAPSFIVPPTGDVQLTMVPRTYRPWNVRGSLEITPRARFTLSITAESHRLAFYRWSAATIHVLYRFNAGS